MRERYERYELIKEKEAMAEEYMMDDADFMITAYGTTARIAKNAIAELREKGIKVGLVRPITLWPFPEKVYQKYQDKVSAILSVEMSMGQMVDDVKLAVSGKVPVHFFGRTGGNVPYPAEIVEAMEKIAGGDK